MTQVVRRTVCFPTWLPIVCWPLLVLFALSGGFLGGAAAVTAATVAIAVGIGLIWGAAGAPEPANSDRPISSQGIASELL